MKTLLLLFVSALGLSAQSPFPAGAAIRSLFYYDGSSNLQYVCAALQFQGTATTYTKALTTITNIVVATNVATATVPAHGLYVGARFTISGATIVPALNATYTVLTSASANTFTFATVAVADATYTDAGLVISTYEPITSAAVWSIQVFTYTSTTLTGSFWATATPSARKPAHSPESNLACSARASY